MQYNSLYCIIIIFEVQHNHLFIFIEKIYIAKEEEKRRRNKNTTMRLNIFKKLVNIPVL